MPLFPKRYFKWKEPREFTNLHWNYQMAKWGWRSRVKLMAVIFLLVVVYWFIAKPKYGGDPRPPLWVAMLLAATLAVLVVCGAPWLERLFDSQVYFFEKHILRAAGGGALTLPYHEIASFSWGVREDFSTLILRRRKSSRDVFVGVPNEVSRAEITDFLQARGVIEAAPSADAPGEFEEALRGGAW